VKFEIGPNLARTIILGIFILGYAGMMIAVAIYK
jgi:hypothetical protein